MSAREVTSQIGTQRNHPASQLPSQLSGQCLFDQELVSTPKEGNREDRSGQGAGVQPGGEAAPDLVK